MDIAELRVKLDNIAAALAEQDVQQEDIAIEEEQVEEVEQPVAEEDSVEEAIEDGKTYAWINVVTGDHGYGTKEESSNWTHYIPMSDFSYFSGDEDYKGLDDETAQEEGWIAVKEEEVHEEEAFEEEAVAEEEVEETVEVPVAALAELMQLAGYENYADKLQEYENEPDEDYSDTEDQMIGLSGGLNGPKKMYPASAPGDNPMDQEPREIEEDAIASVEESLYKSYAAFLEEAEINAKED